MSLGRLLRGVRKPFAAQVFEYDATVLRSSRKRARYSRENFPWSNSREEVGTGLPQPPVRRRIESVGSFAVVGRILERTWERCRSRYCTVRIRIQRPRVRS